MTNIKKITSIILSAAMLTLPAISFAAPTEDVEIDNETVNAVQISDEKAASEDADIEISSDGEEADVEITSDGEEADVEVTSDGEEDSAAEVFTLTIGQNSANVFGEAKENDVQPIIRNDRTMLPARFVAENLGAEVSWDAEARVVTVKNDEVEIKITIDSAIATVNGEEVTLDSPAFIENDRTYTPVRFIAESLGSSVEWDAKTQTVIMSKPGKLKKIELTEIELDNFEYVYEKGSSIIEHNEGAIGGMRLSAEVIGPANVDDILIARWSDEPYEMEEIVEAVTSMEKIWKEEGVTVTDSELPFAFESTHPVDTEDLGKKMYVLLIGLDLDCNAVGYAVVEEVISE
ncbi:MAG: copper amine oxidase N-terminal domain-containing protein [Clostridia bacterium]|nr:copper amine oxidase N-terminal domain-containing protein [Clostridia bacterium]